MVFYDAGTKALLQCARNQEDCQMVKPSPYLIMLVKEQNLFIFNQQTRFLSFVICFKLDSIHFFTVPIER
jgi:hypothetical protein